MTTATTTFTSGFAAKLDAMLDYRTARGYKKETHLRSFCRLDRFCAEYYPKVTELTREIVHAWLDAEAEITTSFTERAIAIRLFGKYLNAINEDAYILPEKFAPHRYAFTPYVFTNSELTALFAAIDKLPPSKNELYISKIAPVMFRLIYTCGLRPNEGRELLRENVNLDTGEILITHTKKNKERIVVMSDDMRDFSRRYDLSRSIFGIGNPYFFPSCSGGSFTSGQVYAMFNKAWTSGTCTPQNPIPRKVRVYGLRHQFASVCLNRWLDSGENLMNMLPYLRAYMGHNTLNETAYYIHILPENLVKSSAIDWAAFNAMFPEVSI
jgi:integrase